MRRHVFKRNSSTAAVQPDLAFQGGAAVDANLGPIAPERKAAGTGDVRVVATPAGDAQAVELLPVLAPGMTAGHRRPVTARQCWSSELCSGRAHGGLAEPA